ncbi:membrane protein [Legionella antarctica]|uniref:Membrane protein n=1 Tax=Legionella antarctica TaxID=2708020 RepID=A0A6F8T5H4_9GAMM|nr:VTT domain-containing protein [Legionella antarctica]BCA95699.1 membrane protein [Legionella antarctica]
MNLFADYVQPLTDWLQTNPRWSLFITFFIALTESLAIIGSIIPGSVTMTAIGILAGSGIMRLDLTLAAATLGAVCGDSLSYALGYFYSERLVEIWPFKKYPHWLKYGEDFFSRHGGKSVLIGRFIGPLRSLIPVIAGILHMKQWRFLLANVISAIGWSLLYILPGALIGAASHGLSAESATRLFVLILILLSGIWLVSLFLKWLYLKLSSFFKRNLHHFWLSFKSHSKLSPLYNALTPKDEPNHFPTAALLLLSLFSLLLFIILIILSIITPWFNCINFPIHLIFQSFHTPLLEAFFIVCTQFTSTITITSLYIICCLWCIYYKHFKVIVYLTSLIISSYLIAVLLTFFIDNPRPQGLQVTMDGASFAANLEIATAFYGFILFYINNKYALLTNTLRIFILVILGLSGVGLAYLGDVWPTDILVAYFAGANVCLIHYLIYRKYNFNDLIITHSATILSTLLVVILFFTSLSTYLNFKTLTYNHTPYRKEYSLNKSIWWNQQKPFLPIYRLNRLGHRISQFNIQYVGDLDLLQNSLEQKGWETHTESFATKLLMKMSSNSNKITFPLLSQLYDNKPPVLIMTYKDSHAHLILELNLWESSYKISELNKHLLIGTLHQNLDYADKNNQQQSSSQLVSPLTYMLPALTKFTLRRIKLPEGLLNSTAIPTTPMILLIKEPDINN